MEDAQKPTLLDRALPMVITAIISAGAGFGVAAVSFQEGGKIKSLEEEVAKITAELDAETRAKNKALELAQEAGERLEEMAGITRTQADDLTLAVEGLEAHQEQAALYERKIQLLMDMAGLEEVDGVVRKVVSSEPNPLTPPRDFASSMKVSGVEHRIVESNEYLAKYSWKVTVENPTKKDADLYGVVQFYDPGGYVLYEHPLNIGLLRAGESQDLRRVSTLAKGLHVQVDSLSFVMKRVEEHSAP